MSVRIVVCKTTLDLLRQHARPGVRFVPGATPRADGMFVLDLDDDVAARLEQVDADPDRAIRIVCTGQIGRA